MTRERRNMVAWAQGEKPGPPDLQALNGDRRLSGVIWETFGFAVVRLMPLWSYTIWDIAFPLATVRAGNTCQIYPVKLSARDSVGRG